jgi:hypothetical protein
MTIRERLEELRSCLFVADSVPFVVHSADSSKLQIFHVSEALCLNLGYPREHLILRSPSLLESDGEECGMEVAIRCGQEMIADVELRHSNGDVIGTEAHLIPVADNTGKVTLFARIYGPCGFPDSSVGMESREIVIWNILKSFIQGYDGISLLKARSLRNIPHPKAYVVADNRLPNCPIVWCSTPFYELFGYDASECLGKNIGFLQGAGTSDSILGQSTACDPRSRVRGRHGRNGIRARARRCAGGDGVVSVPAQLPQGRPHLLEPLVPAPRRRPRRQARAPMSRQARAGRRWHATAGPSPDTPTRSA